MFITIKSKWPYFMKKKTLSIILLISIFSLVVAFILDIFWEDSNFHIVNQQEIYRAAQPMDWIWADGSWSRIYEKYQFKSILNLRGRNQDKSWYNVEMRFSDSKRLNHYDFPISANRQPDLKTMEDMIRVMRDAPKPLLIHCKQGADRTGLASALYAYAITGQSAEQAAKQLSIFYGHFPWLTSGTGAMDRAFAAYVKAHPRD